MKKILFIPLSLIIFISCIPKEENMAKACFEYSITGDIKAGDTLSFINCSSNATNYIWYFGDGDSATVQNPEHIYLNQGNYQIKLLASNDISTDTIEKQITINPIPDDIVYHILTPNIQLHSIRSYYSDGCNHYLPNDSSATHSLDINDDSVVDFTFTAKHHFTGNQCGICADGYVEEIIIDGQGICVYDKNDYLANYLNQSELISNDLTWNPQARLSFQGCKLPFTNYVENSYIGIKCNNKFGWIRVHEASNNGIIIVEYAYNAANGSTILAGQKL